MSSLKLNGFFSCIWGRKLFVSSKFHFLIFVASKTDPDESYVVHVVVEFIIALVDYEESYLVDRAVSVLIDVTSINMK